MKVFSSELQTFSFPGEILLCSHFQISWYKPQQIRICPSTTFFRYFPILGPYKSGKSTSHLSGEHLSGFHTINYPDISMKWAGQVIYTASPNR